MKEVSAKILDSQEYKDAQKAMNEFCNAARKLGAAMDAAGLDLDDVLDIRWKTGICSLSSEPQMPQAKHTPEQMRQAIGNAMQKD